MTKSRSRASARGGERPKRGVAWPVWIGLGGLLLVLAGVAFLARPAVNAGTRAAPDAMLQVTGQPKLSADRDKIDFGTVPLDKPVDATFTLTNTGDKPLQVEGQPTIQVLKGC